jgi:uncharacterized protein (TIGR02594 family)
MSNQTDIPDWVVEAAKQNELREIVGPKHNQTIIGWVKELGGASWRDDETPWCGTFVAHCLQVAGRAYPKNWYRALAYSDYGTKLNKPAYGAIGVMTRKGGGHVTFIIGKLPDGRLACLGGNQNNQVNVTAYPLDRFENFIWPEKAGSTKSTPLPDRFELPIYKGNLTAVTSEA